MKAKEIVFKFQIDDKNNWNYACEILHKYRLYTYLHTNHEIILRSINTKMKTVWNFGVMTDKFKLRVGRISTPYVRVKIYSCKTRNVCNLWILVGTASRSIGVRPEMCAIYEF
jgi:hypothetical protein